MRILLIIPMQSYPQYSIVNSMSSSYFPVGFAYLASSLKAAGHEVFGVNPNNDFSYPSAYDMIRAKISEKLISSRPALVGIGGICTQFTFIKDAIEIVREISPGTPIVCGGGIIKHDADFTFDALGADYCIVSEGEEAIVQLASSIESGKIELSEIDNIGYRVGDKAVFTKRSYDFPDLDSLSFPDYEPFDMDALLDNQYAMGQFYMWRFPRVVPRVMPVITARNCPFKCTFCVHHRGSKYRVRSIGNVLEEIRLLHERYQFNILFVYDELFAAKKSRLIEFCDGIQAGRREHGWDFNWIFQTHANVALDRESLEIAKAAGCFFFSYGVESASPRILASMKKQTRPEQIHDAISIAEQVGIVFYGYYIFGDPAETDETIKETLDFIAEHCEHLHFHYFIGGRVWPYPGSAIFEQCIKNKKIEDKNAFYESVSSLSPRPINMTDFPDDYLNEILAKTAKWGAFEYLAATPVESLTTIPLPYRSQWFPTIKSLVLGRHRYTTLASFAKMFLGNIQFVFLVSTCQYCGARIEYNTFIEKAQKSVVTGCASCNRRVRMVIEKRHDFSLSDKVRLFLYNLVKKAFNSTLRFRFLSAIKCQR